MPKDVAYSTVEGVARGVAGGSAEEAVVEAETSQIGPHGALQDGGERCGLLVKNIVLQVYLRLPRRAGVALGDAAQCIAYKSGVQNRNPGRPQVIVMNGEGAVVFYKYAVANSASYTSSNIGVVKDIDHA